MAENKQSGEIRRSVAVVGCTASGKSALAVGISKELGGEIISVDSMQVYRGMDIGTAKPTKAEKSEVRHHLIDVCDPYTPFSAADYTSRALGAARDITARGKLPVFCGGTGLYLDSVMRGIPPTETASDEKVRAELNEFLEKNGAHALHERLLKLDRESADAIHENNTKRVIRALEICLVSGKTKTEWDAESKKYPPAVDIFTMGIAYRDREILYSRINLRVDEMISNGLVGETEKLYADGIFETNSTAAAAIGYKELLPAIRGEVSLSAAVENLKTATRRYAKRQLTWFSAKPYVHWIFRDGEDGRIKSDEALCAEAVALLGENGF